MGVSARQRRVPAPVRVPAVPGLRPRGRPPARAPAARQVQRAASGRVPARRRPGRRRRGCGCKVMQQGVERMSHPGSTVTSSDCLLGMRWSGQQGVPPDWVYPSSDVLLIQQEAVVITSLEGGSTVGRCCGIFASCTMHICCTVQLFGAKTTADSGAAHGRSRGEL